MTIAMPKPKAEILARRAAIVAAMRAIVPGEGVVDASVEMRVFETDALTAYRQLPLVVVLPETVPQVAAVLRYCHENEVPVVPRGAGTSLSAVRCRWRTASCSCSRASTASSRSISTTAAPWCSRASPISASPRPSSMPASTTRRTPPRRSPARSAATSRRIRAASHCLKYGLTANNVLGVEFVTIEGEVIRLGGKHLDAEGYDLLGLLTGSEGLLGVVTEVTVRILQKPETARAVLIGFPTSEQAGRASPRSSRAASFPAAWR